jgi:hypothetical protein
MDYRFKADDWARLDAAQRVRRCRLWAAEAQQLADNAPLHLKHDYLAIAHQWTKLATDI